MSKEFVERVATEIGDILYTKYRNILNYKEHTLTITKNVIYEAIQKELNFSIDGVPKFPGWVYLPESVKLSILESVKSGLDSIMEKIHKNARNLRAKALKSKRKYKDETSVIVQPIAYSKKVNTITITTLIPENSSLSAEIFGMNRKLDSFTGLYSIYAQEVRDIFNAISVEITKAKKELRALDESTLKNNYSDEILKNIKNSKTIGSKKTRAKLALEHLSDTAVSVIKASKADFKFQQLLNNTQFSESQKQIIIKDFGLEIFLTYDSEINITNMRVEIGSYGDNLLKSQAEAELINNRLNIIKDISNKLKTYDIAKIQGSDSRTTIEKKKIVKSFIEGIIKDKRIKVSSIKNLTPKLSKHKVTKKVKGKTKVSSSKVNIPTKKKTIKGFEVKTTKQPVLNLNALKAQINARLSMTVIKNMGTPALENRTGRFARSVQVTDVTQTSKGFPSIGYTYQKYPYQTFEPGFKQGSTQRDPRTLIDRSIREIASELLVGRFYTRRV